MGNLFYPLAFLFLKNLIVVLRLIALTNLSF